ncbi:MAG: signal peptidase II, partial [Clostridia bacterium]|nr:signal peptidase II [Clostridia bacterium]
MILVLLIIALAVGTDQLTKYIMAGLLPDLEGQTLPVIPGVLHFTYVENTGAAFGMLSEHRWVFMILSVVGLALIALLLLREKPKSAWVRLAAGLVLGGGIGNMIDRMGFGFAEREGAVLDFIDCRFIHFYVFNVADACVTVGCFLYLILIIAGEIKAAREKAAAAEGPGAPAGEG